MPWFIDHRWPGVRSSVVARTRLIDDAITDLVDGRTAQVVVLGAGYDSRPYRLHVLAGVRIFEVDHPDTQAAKQRVLRGAIPTVPKNVRYVASDFNHRQLGSAMAAAGYREAELTLFLWEGVTNYLTEDAVDATLRWCSRAAPGSRLIFTYVHVDVLTDPGKFAGADKLFATPSNAGEQLTFGIHPAELPGFLAHRGLFLEQDIGAADYRERYFKAQARRMVGHEFYRVAIARIDRAANDPAPTRDGSTG